MVSPSRRQTTIMYGIEFNHLCAPRATPRDPGTYVDQGKQGDVCEGISHGGSYPIPRELCALRAAVLICFGTPA